MNAISTQTKTASSIWLAAWVIASAVGIAVGFITTLPLLWSVSESVLQSIPKILAGTLGGAFFGFGVGLATGLAQWLVLRMHGESGTRWLTGSLIGGIVGGMITLLLSAVLDDGGENPVVTIVAFGLFGAILGGGQYFSARSTARNPGWIVASAVGMAAGSLIPMGLAGGALIASLGISPEVANLVVGGLIYGIVTAAALWWLNR